jgi:hypothetical protein
MARPDFVLTIKGRDSKYGVRVGAAWKSEYGYSINIDPGISISSAEGCYVNLTVPREHGDQPARRPAGDAKRTSAGRREDSVPKDDFSDDIPF